MAAGIVEVFAKAGLDVVVRGRSESKVAAALAELRKALDKGVVRGRLTEDERDAAVARVTGTTRLEDLGDVDLVVEAVVEELDVKRAVFAALDEVCKPGAILATTTSSLPVVECAVATARPADVIGMHFFNPAPVMKLVEVVSTVTTSPEVAATALKLCERIDKVPVRCGDRAGFIVNALLFPYLNDAVKMLEAHYATVDDIDAAMTMGCALPMGPFELLDMVGLDEALATERALYAEFREAGSRPRRCWSTWSRRGGWAARPATGSATTTGASAVARANRRRERPRAAALGRAGRVEVGADGEWQVRQVSGSAATRDYRCPGCDQVIPAGTPHVVAWPAADHGSVADRRHWHTPCWAARARRRPGGKRNR